MAIVRCSPVLRIAAITAAIVSLLALRPALLLPTAGATSQERVRLEPGATIALATPTFLRPGRRYAFTWAGGGPPQTHTLKRVREDGWVEVEVAEENVDPSLLVPGTLPTRWLNAALALSIQEMRPLP